MQGTKAAKRYAKALLELSVEQKQEDSLFQQANAFLQIIEQSTDLQQVLISPIIKNEEKQKVLLSVISEETILLKQLILVLTTNKRISLFYKILCSFVNQYYEFKNKQTAVITTAIPISEKLQTQILQRVKEITNNQNISIETKIDTSIIGGFILRIGDLQYNASILNKFKSLKYKLQA